MTTENIQRLLIDTDVIIDHLRNEPKALDYMDSLTEDILISAITLAELYAGVREGTEREQLERFIQGGEELDLDELMPDTERFEKIREAFDKAGIASLVPVREMLGEGFSYEELRLVRIHLRQSDGVLG